MIASILIRHSPAKSGKHHFPSLRQFMAWQELARIEQLVSVIRFQ